MNKSTKHKAFEAFYDTVGPLLSQDKLVEVRIEEVGQFLHFKVIFDETEAYSKLIDTDMANLEEDYIDREMFSMWEDIMGVK